MTERGRGGHLRLSQNGGIWHFLRGKRSDSGVFKQDVVERELPPMESRSRLQALGRSLEWEFISGFPLLNAVTSLLVTQLKSSNPKPYKVSEGKKKKRKEQSAGDAPACKSPLSVPTKGDKSLLAWPIYPHLRGNKPQPEPFHIPSGTTPRPPFPPGPPRPHSAPCPSRGAWEARGESRRGTRPISGRRGTARGRHWIAAGPGGGAGGRDGAGPSGRRRRLLKGTYRPDGPVLARPPAPPARAVGGGAARRFWPFKNRRWGRREACPRLEGPVGASGDWPFRFESSEPLPAKGSRGGGTAGGGAVRAGTAEGTRRSRRRGERRSGRNRRRRAAAGRCPRAARRRCGAEERRAPRHGRLTPGAVPPPRDDGAAPRRAVAAGGAARPVPPGRAARQEPGARLLERRQPQVRAAKRGRGGCGGARLALPR